MRRRHIQDPTRWTSHFIVIHLNVLFFTGHLHLLVAISHFHSDFAHSASLFRKQPPTWHFSLPIACTSLDLSTKKCRFVCRFAEIKTTLYWAGMNTLSSARVSEATCAKRNLILTWNMRCDHHTHRYIWSSTDGPAGNVSIKANKQQCFAKRAYNKSVELWLSAAVLTCFMFLRLEK